jgi:hypothetical protein
MGFNEPYMPDHYLEAEELVELWRKYIQPTAERLDLDLVSFTTTQSNKNTQWFAEFLHGCHMLENDLDMPCRVDAIKYFSIHYYACEEKKWKKNFEPLTGNF